MREGGQAEDNVQDKSQPCPQASYLDSEPKHGNFQRSLTGLPVAQQALPCS